MLVVPRWLVVPGAGWRGVRPADEGPVLAIVATAGRFMPRREAEQDPGHKQIIPYLVLRDGPRFFVMHRTWAGGDARLHDRYSIGVGGHLNPGDVDVAGGLRREWGEELEVGFVPRFRWVGLLNDDETEVGSVHLGLVYEADAAGRPVAIRETDKLRGAFQPIWQARQVYDRMETWSQLVLDHVLTGDRDKPATDRPDGPPGPLAAPR